jgi:hypothetical protein
MVNKEELYVSISPEAYRTNKSNVLKGQADLLGTLKRLHNLTILEKQKRDLKIVLHRLFSSLLSDIDSIQDNLPEPKIPKVIQKSKESEVKVKDSFPERDDIEEELRSIQEKLRELNS